MAIVDHNGEAEFPVSKDKVFDAMLIAIPTIQGLTIDSADKFLGRIVVKGALSLASWGENVPIQLTSIDENKTKVSITSSPKTGIMFGGANDMGKNRKNIERIFSATSQVLQGGQISQPQQQYNSQQSAYTQQPQTTKRKMSLGKKILIGAAAILVIGIIGSQLDKGKKERSLSSSDSNSENIESSSKKNRSSTDEETNKSSPGVGEVLHTEYFDVTVNKVAIKDKVNTGNEFADLNAEPDNKYLIINTTFKNTDNESRMIMDGSVYINYKGKDYEFDKSETIMLEGWGTMLDQINPLTSKTTNLVYKIPDEIKGTAFWNPGRSDKDQVINLGDIR